MIVYLRHIALYATLLNKTKKTIRKKRPNLLENHVKTLESAKQLFERLARHQKEFEDIKIDDFSLGEEMDRYSVQFLNSYLGSQSGKVTKDTIYKDLNDLRLYLANRIANQSANEVLINY